MEGKHVVICCPQNTGSLFFNYKKPFSLILFAVVDANYSSIYVGVGKNCRTNDALVFSKCSFNQALENGSLKIPSQGVFVGDAAFSLRTNFLNPYSKNALNIKERVFNYRLSRARRVSENSFGILAARFRIYENPINLLVETTEILVKATCALHKWLRQSSQCKAPYISVGLMDVELWEEGRLLPGRWRENERKSFRKIHIVSSNNHRKSASVIRDSYAEEFFLLMLSHGNGT